MIKKIVGIIITSIPFLFIFTVFGLAQGFGTAALVIGTTVAIVGLIGLGVFLMID